MAALRRHGLLGAAAAIVLALAACGGTSRPLSEGSSQAYHPAPLALRARSAPHVTCAVRSSVSYAAVVRGVAAAYARPGGRLVARLMRVDLNGYPTVLGVLGMRRDGCSPTWYRVQLPGPPNGSSAWMPARAVRVYAVPVRVVVRLSTRRLVLYRSGRPVFRARVAVGAQQTPTPVGTYFVNERFLLDSSGPFGVAALGISAHSDVLKDWVQGGPIALHGTDEPGSIGRAVSHGCIRLSNDDMRRLFALVPAGTPVTIRR